MAKKVCTICEQQLGMLTFKTEISDGFVCAGCLAKAGIGTLGNPKSYTSDSVKNLINSRIPLAESFNPTKEVYKNLIIDENNKLFKIGLDLFEYQNLLNFELSEDGEAITKGGLGRAVAGGVLLGPVGAVVGGVTGGKKSKTECTSMQIKITLRNAHTDTATISFIGLKTKKGSPTYIAAKKSADACLAALQIIADINEAGGEQVAPATQTASAADEILKFKQLLDAGVITQEEFDAKKKQLLGL